LAAVEGLGQVVGRAGTDGGHGVWDAAVGREQDDPDLGPVGQHFLEQPGPPHARHLHVRDDAVHRLLGQEGQGVLGAVGQTRPVARGHEARFENLKDVRVVVDREDRVLLAFVLFHAPVGKRAS
jgi:hypothetical protein